MTTMLRPEIDLVPLKQFSRRIAQGWTMVPGYPLQPGDFAVTMMSPAAGLALGSNLSRAAQTRNREAARKRAERDL